ncbi:MAG: hypothetical protein AAB834_01420, partial [Patescibacteria group bacterium]
MVGHAASCALIDLGANSTLGRMLLRHLVLELARGYQWHPHGDAEWYGFFCGLEEEEVARHGMVPGKGFSRLPDETARALGCPPPAYSTCWLETPKGYLCEVVTPIEEPWGPLYGKW